ncbi:hypothetical protein OIU34_22015 [Pararhizobium sp. BT-229]|uniref:hypothetical protein n=1 Tax=Pararhizobium sp. BT-229 TaxID=2986923 RepID=UPI0021F7740A|nr:hypothetical protein [Pararhizobium sp. BT-229]MCV9964569.1 hypothetical protein [Pararhizobium sp. BT-229]
MKVEIPFVYQVNYKKPRMPSWSHSDILCSAAVDIVDIPAADAPVVHVVSDESAGVKGYSHSSTTTTVSKFHVPGGDCLIRKHGDQHYASRFPVDEIAKWRGNREFDPFAVEIGLRTGDSEFKRTLDTKIEGTRAVSLDVFHAKEGEVKKFSSERAMTDRYIHMLSGQFAVIDGVLYEKVREPVVSAVLQPGGSLSVYIEEAISPTLTRFQKGEWRGAPGERIRFGLDEFDRAMKVSARLAVQNKLTLAVHARVKQASPTEVRFRGDHEYLFSAAKGVAGQLRSAVAYMTESAGMAVLDAANLLAVHDRLTPSALAAVRRMEAELRTYFAGDHQAPPTQDTMHDYDLRQAFGGGWKWKLDRLTDALAHWDARDDIGLEWFDKTLDALPVYDYPRRAYEVSSLTDMDKLAMRWEGGLPSELAMADPEVSAIVVVEDFEEFRPLAAMVYDRNNLMLPPQVFGNPDPQTVASEVVLASTFVQSAKVEAAHSLSLSSGEGPSFRP